MVARHIIGCFKHDLPSQSCGVKMVFKPNQTKTKLFRH